MARAAITIKVLPKTHERLQEIAKEDDRTIGEIVTKLVEKYDRERFWEGVSEDLARFKSHEKAYKQYGEEFAEWDSWTTRSLLEEPPYYEDSEK